MMYLVGYVNNDNNVKSEIYKNKEEAYIIYKKLQEKYEETDYNIFIEEKEENQDFMEKIEKEEEEEKKYEKACKAMNIKLNEECRLYMEDLESKLKSLNITTEDIQVYLIEKKIKPEIINYVLLMRKRGKTDDIGLDRKEMIEKYYSD